MKKSINGKCPECHKDNLVITFLKVKTNYPFGRKSNPVTQVVKKVIECSTTWKTKYGFRRCPYRHNYVNPNFGGVL